MTVVLKPESARVCTVLMCVAAFSRAQPQHSQSRWEMLILCWLPCITELRVISNRSGVHRADDEGAPVVGAWAGRGNVKFTPPLPASKINAIKAIGYGVLNKV